MKSRLVAKEYNQAVGIDNDEMFFSHIKTKFDEDPNIYSSNNRLGTSHQMDEFLHGDLQELVNIQRPLGFVTGRECIKSLS